ncbi:MAG: tetratricopeptide repeat protein, partial [Candidatus Rifleibacteriota bacterium]
VIRAAETEKTQVVSEKTVVEKESAVKPEVKAVQAPVVASAPKKMETDAVVYGAKVEKTEKKPEPAVQEWDDSLADAVAIENVGFEQAAEAIRKSAFNEYSRGNWERSLPLYLEYLKKKPDPKAYDIVSIIFEKLKMPQDAFEASEHAYNMGFKDHSTLIRLGRLAEETGRFQDGEKYLKMALEKSPHRVDIRIRYARCLAKTGQQDKAIAELEDLAKANSSSYSVKTRIETELKQIQSKGY